MTMLILEKISLTLILLKLDRCRMDLLLLLVKFCRPLKKSGMELKLWHLHYRNSSLCPSRLNKLTIVWEVLGVNVAANATIVLIYDNIYVYIRICSVLKPASFDKSSKCDEKNRRDRTPSI